MTPIKIYKNLLRRTMNTLLILILLMFMGCNKYNIPRGFPNPDKMADILTDILILESTITYAPGVSAYRDRNIAGYYAYVLNRHGIAPEQFDTIRKWYNNNPQLYQLVYDKVLARLSEREADVRILIEREQEDRLRLSNLPDIDVNQPLNLWRDTSTIHLSLSDTIDARLPFRYSTDTLELSGLIKLAASYKFLRNDASRSPRMMLSAFYPDSTADTVYHSITHSFHRTNALLELNLRRDTFPVEIYGFLMLQDSTIRPAVEITNISIIVVKDSVPVNEPHKILVPEELIR